MKYFYNEIYDTNVSDNPFKTFVFYQFISFNSNQYDCVFTRTLYKQIIFHYKDYKKIIFKTYF